MSTNCIDKSKIQRGYYVACVYVNTPYQILITEETTLVYWYSNNSVLCPEQIGKEKENITAPDSTRITNTLTGPVQAFLGVTLKYGLSGQIYLL